MPTKYIILTIIFILVTALIIQAKLFGDPFSSCREFSGGIDLECEIDIVRKKNIGEDFCIKNINDNHLTYPLSCFQAVAIAKKDKTICRGSESFEVYNYAVYTNTCYMTYAKQLNDVAACDEIMDISYRQKCISEVEKQRI